MITVLGSSNVDIMAYADHLPVHGETALGHDLMFVPGGKGANQAAAAARLGSNTVFLSKIGEKDKNAGVIIDGLKWANVDISKLGYEPDVYCGTGIIMVGKNGQNVIITIKGANDLIDEKYFMKHESLLNSTKVFVTELQVPTPAVEVALKAAKKAGVMSIVTPNPPLSFKDNFYSLIDIIIPNEFEAHELSGIVVNDKSSASKAADFFHSKGIPSVIITMGRNGAFVSQGKRTEIIPIIDLPVIDTTGAGDAYAGGLAYSLNEGNDLFSAAVFASYVASLSVTKLGTMNSMPDLNEVNKLKEKFVLELQ